MYNRGPAPGKAMDPWVSVRDHDPTRLIVYAESSAPWNIKLLETEGGMDVFIKQSTPLQPNNLIPTL